MQPEGAPWSPALLELLRCPFCRVAARRGRRRLVCPGCGRQFEIEDGIPLMLHATCPGPGRSSARTKAGWRRRRRKAGTSPTTTIDCRLPFPEPRARLRDGTWRANGHSFQVLLDRYVDGKGSRPARARGRRRQGVGGAVLAGARLRVRRHGHPHRPEHRARARRVLRRVRPCPGRRRAPAVRRRTFDVTYCCRDAPPRARPPRDGRRDGARHQAWRRRRRAERGHEGLGRSSENPDQAAEKELGINEHVHTVWAYVAAFARAGLVRPAGRAVRRATRPCRGAGRSSHASRRSGRRSARSPTSPPASTAASRSIPPAVKLGREARAGRRGARGSQALLPPALGRASSSSSTGSRRRCGRRRGSSPTSSSGASSRARSRRPATPRAAASRTRSSRSTPT